MVRTPDELAAAAGHALQDAAHLAAARRRVANVVFFDPGNATTRALQLIRGLLHPAAAVTATQSETAS